MSSKIDILKIGYAELLNVTPIPNNKYMRATGSCCLVRSGRRVILFDTLGPWEKNFLLSKLETIKIHPDDLDYIVCSHSHPDHIGNLNLFTKAKKHFVGTSVYSQDIYDLNRFEPSGSFEYESIKGDKETIITYDDYKLDRNLTIEPTPGHTLECISMIVENCDKLGTVGLVGDLFEREEDVRDESIWLGAGSQNNTLQRAHRNRIYNKVDFILPGHGPLFKRDPSVANF